MSKMHTMSHYAFQCESKRFRGNATVRGQKRVETQPQKGLNPWEETGGTGGRETWEMGGDRRTQGTYKKIEQLRRWWGAGPGRTQKWTIGKTKMNEKKKGKLATSN